MKNIIFIFILLLSVYSSAQVLFTDEKGVKIFYEIQQTEKFVLCEDNPNLDENFSKEKIFIWKVTFGIENGYSDSIVPRGVGIATISVIPNPIKPYSHNYCNYKYLENYEPNSVQRHLDQSLFIWAIRDHKVEEIKPKEVIKATTYLYLYEGQTPELSNWQFLGYRLKKDFKSFDPILNDIVNQPKSITLQDDKTKEKVKNLEAKYIAKANSIEIPIAKFEKINVKIAKTASSDLIPVKEIKVVKDDIKKSRKDIITVEEIKPSNTEAVDISLNTTKVASLNSNVIKKIQPAKHDKKEVDNASVKCPGEKAQEYREKSNNSSDASAQKAYSWLVLYYTYKCECEMGSPRSGQLVPMINNVVDSYTTNTNNAFGKISKVNKCTASIKNK